MVRHLILATVGIALIGAKPAPNFNAQGEQRGRNRPASAQGAPALAATPKQNTAPRQDASCEPGQDKRQSDLCAQWKAADAAHDAALSARAQTLIGYIGLALGMVTMLAAIAAALYARRAAVATEETVGIARDAATGAETALAIAQRNADAATKLAETSETTAERQLRAYLSAKSVTMEQTEHNDDRFIFNLQITNNGQTPGVMQKIVFHATWVFEGGDTKLLQREAPNIYKCHRDTPMNLPFGFCGDFDGCEKEGHMLVVGRIDYKDAFGKLQKESFGWRTPDDEYGPFYDICFPVTLHAYSVQTVLAMIDERKAALES